MTSIFNSIVLRILGGIMGLVVGWTLLCSVVRDVLTPFAVLKALLDKLQKRMFKDPTANGSTRQ